jgi:hypothetical protein
MNTKRTSLLRRFPGAIVAAAAIAALSSAVLADDIKLTLGGDMEVPPVITKASGSGTITIAPDMTVSGRMTTTGIAATMAHIHLAAKGVNGPVIVQLTKDGDNGWVVPAGAKLTDAQYQSYKAGDLYVNVHSEEHKGGEIRGQLAAPMSAAKKSGY